MANISVVIAGGSLNGLSTALLLARRKVPCLVVERHPATSIQYKFRGISPRSMEIFREAGIEAEIRACDSIDDRSAYVARMKNLSESQVAWQGVPWADTSDISPTTAATCDQDRLEPILKKHAERLGADILFNTELIDFTQGQHSVTSRIRNRGNGEEQTVTSDYLIAADGVNGASREKVGIGRHGPGVLQHWMNVIFETEMKPTLQGRALRSVFVTDINGTFVPRDGGRWLMAVQFVPETGERPEDFGEAHCLELIRRGAGRSDLNARIVDIRPWEVTAYIADQYSKNRVFLLGDAAHVMPPTGGFGGNTGIHDAHNIAWKLDAVLRNKAGKALLETYDEERRPIGERTLAQSLARLQAWFKDPSKKLPASEPIIDDYAVIFGYRYPSGSLVADGDPSDDIFENPRTPSGAPGSRAPHVIVERNGERFSTIDVFAGKWVLVAGPDGGSWLDAASRIGAAGDLNLQSYRVGGADLRDVDDRWSASYGVAVDGAVLIRPDGFIVWRAKNARSKPEATLREAFEQLTFRDSRSERRAS